MVGAVALALTGCAALDSVDRGFGGSSLAEELTGFRQGETQDCLPVTLDDASPHVVDDRTIVYQRTRGQKWVTSLPNSCPGLRPTSTLVIQKLGNRTCRLDRFTTIQPGLTIPGPVCAFGAFVRYDRVR